MGKDGLMLLFVVGLVVILAGIQYLGRKLTIKANTAIRNKRVQREEAQNPPQRMKLADLYGGQAPASGEPGSAPPMSPRFCPQCGKELEPGSVFCPSCGTKIGS